MIFGVGVDIVEIARIENALARRGERFAQRVLSPAELDEFRRHRSPAHFLAKRFAAKEAWAKALGTGFRAGISLRDVGVSRDALGKPLINLAKGAKLAAQARGVGGCFLSLADERHYAVAYVLLTKQP